MEENHSKELMIGHYRTTGKIGQGGFGRVYQAQNTELPDHIVAIKVLYANDLKARERFRQEARVLLKLKHPYILPFRDFFSNEDCLYLVTDYAGYGSLRDRLNRSPDRLSMEEVRLIASQVGQALQYIHERKVIHCDLKPENILFNTPGKALLADFGIAKIVATVSLEQGEIIGRGTGTPAYMAPEQIKGKPGLQSDQYAFACLIYELLTKRPPFKGSWYIVQQQHLTEQPADPRTLNQDISEHMALALLKALAKEPDDRYANMHAFLAALGVPLAQETIQLSQKNLEELLNEGKVLLQRGHVEDALTIYNQIIDLNPKLAEAYCGRAGTLIAQPGPGVDVLAAALTDYNRAIKLDQTFIPAYIGKGDVLCLLRRYRLALRAYQMAVNIVPDPALYLKIAEAYSELKEDQKVLAAYEAAIRCGADTIEIRRRKIKLLLTLKEYREVIKEYNNIIRIAPDPLSTCYEKIKFLLSIRYYDQAPIINEVFAAYEQIIKLKHGAMEIYFEEITALENLIVSPDKRLEVFGTLIKRVPDSIKIHIYHKIVEILKILKRPQEVSAIYDQLIELTPDDFQVRREKLTFLEQLGWPEDSREGALVMCDQIIKHVPTDIDMHRTKLALLELLKYPVHVVVDECDQLLILDGNCADIYHQRGRAYEMLAGVYANGKNNALSVRLRKVPEYYLDALADYEEASQRTPNNLVYRESKKKLLNSLGKPNQAKLSQRPASRPPTVVWLIWMLPFLVLPTLVNTAIGTFLVVVLQGPEMWMGVALGAFCISVFGVVVVELNDKPYHLYNASLLLFPIACFTIGWPVVDFLVSRPEMSINILLLLVVLFIVLAVNTVIYVFIDFYEEQTLVFISILILAIILGILVGVVKVLKWIGKGIVAVYNAEQEQRKMAAQKAKEAKVALAKKPVTKQGSLSKVPPTSSKVIKNTSSRRENSVKKPMLSSSSKSFNDSHPKQANTIKKTIPRK